MSAITFPAAPAAPALEAPAPRPARRRRSLALQVLLGAVALLLATSCTGRHPIPTGYGKDNNSTVAKNFIKGCQNPGGGTKANSLKLCTCFYGKVKDQIPFDDFKSINSDLTKHPQALPKRMLVLLDACKAKQ